MKLFLGTLLTALLLAIAAVSPGRAQAPFEPPGLQRAVTAQERHTDRLLRNEDVVGTAVGLTAAGQPAVMIFTKRDGAAGLPRSLDGVPVLVRASGAFFAVPHKENHNPGGGGKPDGSGKIDPTGRFARPVPIGVSIGNIGLCSAGTIGARVTDGVDVYALSNNHVLALIDSAPLGSQVLQPGLADTNCDPVPDNGIGALFDYVEINFTENVSNTVDAAIALSSTGNLGNSTPADGYGTPSSSTVPASVRMRVQKYGRTTSLTKGRITGVNATIDVGYRSGTARFVRQIIVESGKSFLRSGDSGSLLVVDGGVDDLSPVGLMFAANSTGRFAVANPIDLVLDAFAVSIDGP